jgi:prepilin-type N-terminal cleavage/methylation domain-containing protein
VRLRHACFRNTAETVGRTGFTLAEVLVSLVILQVGLLGVAGQIGVAHKLLDRAVRLEWAVAVAESVADSLSRFGYSGEGSIGLAAGRVGWEPWSGGDETVLVWVEDRTARRLVEVAVSKRLPPSVR